MKVFNIKQGVRNYKNSISKIVEFMKEERYYFNRFRDKLAACIWYMDRFQFEIIKNQCQFLLKVFHLLIFTKKKIAGIYNYTQNI